MLALNRRGPCAAFPSSRSVAKFARVTRKWRVAFLAGIQPAFWTAAVDFWSVLPCGDLFSSLRILQV